VNAGGPPQPGVHRALAPAKVNLGLFLGPTRASDGRHELVTVMQSISLADELTLEAGEVGAIEDEVVCPGVPGPPERNLATVALAAFRARTGWRAPPLRLSIEKRIPLAAGLAGGSADAAATLRLAMHVSELGDERLLRTLAQELGADVPAQVAPGRWLATGAGEQLRRLPSPREQPAMLLLALPLELSTAAVYREADRLGLAREPGELRRLGQQLVTALAGGEPAPAAVELLHNDLQRAAVSLCPQIADALAQASAAGADAAFVSGSGPTVVGMFFARVGATEDDTALRRAERAAASLRGRDPAPVCATPVDAACARPQQAARPSARR
jgi:4-diphosphocytidyl-2-C-methyl-D-erythritol kinase